MRFWNAVWPAAIFVLAACLRSGGDSASRPEFDVLLEAGQTVGQTFVARHAGLNGIEVFMSPERPGDGRLLLRLRADSHATEDLAVTVLPVEQVAQPAFYNLDFSPLAGSERHYYYASLELVGTGAVRIGTEAGTAYLDGAQYVNGQAVDAQTMFRLRYSFWPLVWEQGRTAAKWLAMGMATLLLFVLPGWALLEWFWPRHGLSWPEAVGIAAGLSLAIHPLLLLWTSLVGLRLGPWYAWLPIVGGLALPVTLAVRRGPLRWAGLRSLIGPWSNSGMMPADIAFVAVAILVLAVRFWAAGAVDVPMWGDSYQHTVISQLLVDNRGLFDSWRPYAELRTFTYHYGFHAAAAALQWATGAGSPRAVMWAGQMINGLAVLALYPLAVRVGGNRWAGVGAVLLAGLLSPMPMYYVNWGRYTQLAGQAILPGAACLMWSSLEDRRRRWGLIGLSALSLAGVALTHYRVLVFAVILFAILIVAEVGRGRLSGLAFNALAASLAASLLFLPWLIHIFSGRMGQVGFAMLSPSSAPSLTWTERFDSILGLLWFRYLPLPLWLLLPLVVAWGLWRRRGRGAAIVGAWWLVNLIAASPQWFNLPGRGILTTETVLMAAYIPAGVLVGAGLGWLMQAARHRRSWLYLLLGVAILGVWGARLRLGDVLPAEHALATRPDVRAAEWIRHNTPPDAFFLTNSFLAFNNTVSVGSDGGWWLPILAGRQTTQPPINYVLERGWQADYRQSVVALTAMIQGSGPEAPDVLAALEERGVTHVYIGQRQGRVNYGGPVIEPEQLLASLHYHLAYHEDRVWIFEFCGRAADCEG